MKQNQLPLLKKLVVRYLKRSNLPFHYHYEDALSTAIVGFYEAMQSYDASYNTRFSTHLWYVLRNKIGQYIHKELRQIELCQILTKKYSPITKPPESKKELYESKEPPSFENYPNSSVL